MDALLGAYRQAVMPAPWAFAGRSGAPMMVSARRQQLKDFAYPVPNTLIMSQGKLFEDAAELLDDLPSQERFPINSHGRQVKDPVEQDLFTSRNPLIITGYTSLNKLIGFLASCRETETSYTQIRVLLGHEPTSSPQQEFHSTRHRFSQDISDYWLDRGISITLCAKVLAVIDLIDTGIIQTRISSNPNHPVHAKIYQADQAVTIGSSNFSHFGFSSQTEGNVRFLQKEEPQRFSETKKLAEYIWRNGVYYNLKKLLQQLLHEVSWQEALARACAEVLEGKWAKHYIFENLFDEPHVLWPSQEQGIAQAMWVIENVGSVLIADATGSGKTKMAAYLMRSIAEHIAKTGRRRRDLHTLICPPGVREAWKQEIRDCGLNVTPYSSGALSQKNAREHEGTKSAIRRSQMLTIDEAHNFFNRTSQRTQAIFESVADYILLLTATPINRGAYDLLAVVDLLGADNLDENVIDVLKPLWRRRGELDDTMSPIQKETLQRAIQQFTVRRTKTMLNSLVAQEPERYQDRNGRQCRYPRNGMKEYLCNETENDREIAVRIREQTSQLYGLINLQRCLRLSEAQRKDGVTEEDYLRWRLQGAKGLAGHHVTASLRSSRAALLEHLLGTDYAVRQLGFTASSKSKNTGDIMHRLLEGAGNPPGHELEIPVPDWLIEPAVYRQACEQEVATYQTIVNLALQISPAREEAKAALLGRLLEENELVLAFDHHPVTLDDLKYRLENKTPVNIIIATGDSPSEQARLSKVFGHGSTLKKTIALCSDAMSEGRNLQAASVVVHLDMPTVVRQAEQRIGRIDRMDSEHPFIEVYWPDDAQEFKLRADERFHARHKFMAELIGSNIEIPKEIVTPKQMADEMEQTELWDGLEDAFAPLRHLISGENRLVPEDVYEKICHSTARVISSVCAVKSSFSWAFFAIAGTEWGAPRWVYMKGIYANPETDLEKIAQNLRESLMPETRRHNLDERAVGLLSQFISHLADTEKLLLPKKKQRALDEMDHVLKSYEKQAHTDKDSIRLGRVQELLNCLDHRSNNSSIDLARLSERWLDVIRPIWYQHLHHRKRSEPLRLKHIRESLKGDRPLSNSDLESVLDAVCQVKPLADRVVAAIIGVS